MWKPMLHKNRVETEKPEKKQETMAEVIAKFAPRGRMGGFGLGPGGECVCPKCGYKTPHETGKPCYLAACPKCGTKMTRDTGDKT